MSKMSISDFYERLLIDKEFQEPETGNLFFPAYIYQYDPKEEYSIRKQILNLKERLIRPNNYVDTLILNIFDEFLEFLKSEKMGEDIILDLILNNDKERELNESLKKVLFNKATSIEFFNFINDKATKHFKEPK
jgi:hypothetical protein